KEPVLRAARRRALRDLPPGPPRRPAPAQPAALPVPPGAPHAVRVGVPHGAGTGFIARLRPSPARGVGGESGWSALAVRITVLGKSPAWQDAGGACSGYLVEAGDRCLLLDCGNGVFGKLRAARDFTRVCAVVISHLHADHFIDLVPYAYALAYSHQARAAGHRPVLYAPPGARETFRRITGAWQAE